MPFGMVRLDPRLYTKLSKIAEKNDLYLRDLIDYILEMNEQNFNKFAKDLVDEIESGEEDEEEEEAEGGGSE